MEHLPIKAPEVIVRLNRWVAFLLVEYGSRPRPPRSQQKLSPYNASFLAIVNLPGCICMSPFASSYHTIAGLLLVFQFTCCAGFVCGAVVLS